MSQRVEQTFKQTGVTTLLNDMCTFSCAFIVSLLHLFNCSPPLLSLPLCSFFSVCSCQQSRPPMLKALFFSRCGPACPSSLKTRLFLEGNKQPFSRCLSPSLFFLLPLFLYPSLSLSRSLGQKAERVGWCWNASSRPCPVHPAGGY